MSCNILQHINSRPLGRGQLPVPDSFHRMILYPIIVAFCEAARGDIAWCLLHLCGQCDFVFRIALWDFLVDCATIEQNVRPQGLTLGINTS